MITVLSLSPAIDKRLEFESFILGGTNRVRLARAEGAGKGIDVALAAQALGLPAHCVGILAGGGEPVTERLERNNVAYSFLPAPGQVRINQKLFDRTSGITTEVNEPVPEAPPSLLTEIFAMTANTALTSEYLVLNGSLPQGCPSDWYGKLIRHVRGIAPKCRVILDADGDSLCLGMENRPWLVKPNLDELEQASGKPLKEREDILAAALSLCALGAQVVVVSMGENGAMAVTENKAVFSPGIREPIQTTTGAGDAMVAGLIKGFSEGDSLAEALRNGIAAATARCAFGGDAFLKMRDFARFLTMVEISTIR